MTPDEADAQLAKAVKDHAEAHGLFADDQYRFLSDFVIVASWETASDDGQDRYTRHSMNQRSASMHSILGLLTVGVNVVSEWFRR